LGLPAAVVDELTAVKMGLLEIKEVELAYAETSRDSLSVVVVIPDKNEDVVQKIIAAESEIMDTFPNLDVDFDVIFRCGREIASLVTPRGIRLVNKLGN
jgi:hypothetical protein